VRGIFGHKREDVRGRWKMLLNEELYNILKSGKRQNSNWET